MVRVSANLMKDGNLKLVAQFDRGERQELKKKLNSKTTKGYWEVKDDLLQDLVENGWRWMGDDEKAALGIGSDGDVISDTSPLEDKEYWKERGLSTREAAKEILSSSWLDTSYMTYNWMQQLLENGFVILRCVVPSSCKSS